MCFYIDIFSMVRENKRLFLVFLVECLHRGIHLLELFPDCNQF